MRVAALDYGKARIGVAVTDELGLFAHPRPPIEARNFKAAVARIAELSRDEGIERFVVGLPLSLRGDEGESAAAARKLAQAVADATGLDVELFDERLSTVQASRSLREAGHSARAQKGKIDSASAAIVLQAWLDAQGRRG